MHRVSVDIPMQRKCRSMAVESSRQQQAVRRHPLSNRCRRKDPGGLAQTGSPSEPPGPSPFLLAIPLSPSVSLRSRSPFIHLSSRPCSCPSFPSSPSARRPSPSRHARPAARPQLHLASDPRPPRPRRLLEPGVPLASPVVHPSRRPAASISRPSS